jgi:hypothetical protein
MQKYMSQDEYFKLMETEEKEQKRRNSVYRKYTGRSSCRSNGSVALIRERVDNEQKKEESNYSKLEGIK